ncbi:hypothetical protein LZG72_22585 [Dyadobacter sp. CY323]|nr:hypothetical protein [Dyadobacter sp. CY323]
MLTAQEELATTDLDGTRKYLDEISYNIRSIFHGDPSETTPPEYKPVDIAEHLMDAVDVLTYAVEKLTAFQVNDEELPKVNSIISSLRNVIESVKTRGSELKSSISREYYDLFLYKLDDLTEVVDDAESIFFDLRKDKDFMASVNKLLGLQ